MCSCPAVSRRAAVHESVDRGTRTDRREVVGVVATQARGSLQIINPDLYGLMRYETYIRRSSFCTI